MSSTGAAFAGAIPQLYDLHLRTLLFEPYARNIARRAAALGPADLLETAAGTGLATVALRQALPEARITATDLNPAMLELATARLDGTGIVFRPADAQSLPFEAGSFDLVVCQFGMMFLPDRPSGYAEARRVLRPGGAFLFSVWDRLEHSPVADIVAKTVASLFPDDPPDFFSRIPWALHDVVRLEAELEQAGYSEVGIVTVEERSLSPSPGEAALGLCQGTPLRGEIEARGSLAEATKVAEQALVEAFGPGSIDQPMSAHIILARRD